MSDRLSSRGGADQHLLQVIGWAAGAGFEVTVAIGRVGEVPPLPTGVRVETLKGLASMTSSEARLATLPALLEATDLVHVQNVMNPAALAAATATGKAVVTVQDHRLFCPGMGRTLPDGRACDRKMGELECAECLPDGEYRSRIIKLTEERQRALGRARLIVLSRYMAEELADAGLEGATVVPPWVEVDDQEPREGSGFVLAGRLVAHKAVLDAYTAWRRAATGMPLAVAGEGPLAGRLADAELLGWLPNREMRAVLRDSRALLFPSWWQEPFGIIGIEALAVGTPVIVASTGGTSEWDVVGCIHVAPGDVDGMAAAIAECATKPQLAVSLGERGRAQVAERFARGRVEARLAKVYAELTAKRG